MKVQAHSSLELPLEYNQDQTLDEPRFIITFLTILGVTEILCNFRLVIEGEIGKEIPESSRLNFLEKNLADNFALSDAEDNTSGLLNRGSIADLPLLRTLLAIQKSPESQVCVMDSFVFFCFSSIWKLGSFRNPFQTIITRL